jgi:hypothetical protein
VTVVSAVAKAGSGFSKANTTDLGILELSEGTPTRFDLGAERIALSRQRQRRTVMRRWRFRWE